MLFRSYSVHGTRARLQTVDAAGANLLPCQGPRSAQLSDRLGAVGTNTGASALSEAAAAAACADAAPGGPFLAEALAARLGAPSSLRCPLRLPPQPPQPPMPPPPAMPEPAAAANIWACEMPAKAPKPAPPQDEAMSAVNCCCNNVTRCMSCSICWSFTRSRCTMVSTSLSRCCTCSRSGFAVACSARRVVTLSTSSLWCFSRSALWLWAWMVCQSSCLSMPTSLSQTDSNFPKESLKSDFDKPPPPPSSRDTRSLTNFIFSLTCSILAFTLPISLPTLASFACLAWRIIASTCWPMSLAISYPRASAMAPDRQQPQRGPPSP
mmetsp:Transcript_93627/g.238405  ORF Transcript_93627/g.238405 Transcript_93627/m.238405 type:complete len:323 (-) Transcript_93627:80-1048(-)